MNEEAQFVPTTKGNEFSSLQTTWSAPSNIALVKYWGKKELQIPCNPSISFTLEQCRTTASVRFERLKDNCGHFDLSFLHRSEYLNSAYFPDKTKEWKLNRIQGDLYEDRVRLHFSTNEYNPDHIDNFFKFSDFLESRRYTMPDDIVEVYERLMEDHVTERRSHIST